MRYQLIYVMLGQKQTFSLSYNRLSCILKSFFLFSDLVTPEKQQSAVIFRKQLRSCKCTQPPCSLDKWPSSSIKLQSSKGTSATSMATLSLWSRFLLGLVQVAGFNSEREPCNMVEKHKRCFSGIRTLSKSLDKGILMSLL